MCGGALTTLGKAVGIKDSIWTGVPAAAILIVRSVLVRYEVYSCLVVAVANAIVASTMITVTFQQGVFFPSCYSDSLLFDQRRDSRV